MIRVKFTDNGEVMEVKNYEELVDIMRSQSFALEKTNSEFMKNYAKRAVLFKNEDIRATGIEEFIEDLIKYNHIAVL